MTYRTGNHQPQNLYRGDAYIGVMFDPADTALIVDAMESRRAIIDSAIRSVGLCPKRAEHHLMTSCGSCCYTRHADGDAPSRPLSTPVAAQEAPVGETGPTGGVETISGGCRETIWDGPYAMRCGRGDGRTCPRHGAVI